MVPDRMVHLTVLKHLENDQPDPGEHQEPGEESLCHNSPFQGYQSQPKAGQTKVANAYALTTMRA